MEHLCLQWNNHQATLLNVFDRLLSNETLIDVSLCAEGRIIGAHKLVLSACSSYFEALFTQCGDKHPVVFLKDVKFDVLQYLMDYMYRGEINVSHEELPLLIKTAESLQIKGLVNDKSKSLELSSKSTILSNSHPLDICTPVESDYESPAPAKKLKADISSVSSVCAQSVKDCMSENKNSDSALEIPTVELTEDSDVKLDLSIKEEHMEAGEDVNNEEHLSIGNSNEPFDSNTEQNDSNFQWEPAYDHGLDNSQYSMSSEPSGIRRWRCSKCNRSYTQRYNLLRHIKHECGVSPKFQCPICNKLFKRKDNVKEHVRVVHSSFAQVTYNDQTLQSFNPHSYS